MKNNSLLARFKNMKNKWRGCPLNRPSLKIRSTKFNNSRNSWKNNFIFWRRRKKA
jgi:hypothetical protein